LVGCTGGREGSSTEEIGNFMNLPSNGVSCGKLSAESETLMERILASLKTGGAEASDSQGHGSDTSSVPTATSPEATRRAPDLRMMPSAQSAKAPGQTERRRVGRPSSPGKGVRPVKIRDKAHGKIDLPANISKITDLPASSDCSSLGEYDAGVPIDHMKAAIARSLAQNRNAPTETLDQKLKRMRGLTSGRISAFVEEEKRLAEAAAAADKAAQKTLMDGLIKEFEAEGHDPEKLEALKRAASVALSDDPDAHTDDGEVREVVKIEGNQPAQTAFLRDMEPGAVLAQGGWGCVAGWTRIDHPDGTSTPIADLFEAGYPFTVVTGLGPKVCPPPIKLPPAELFTVKFTNGSEITVHPDHKFFAPWGWKPLREMEVGDYISSCHEKFAKKHDSHPSEQPVPNAPINQLTCMALNALDRLDGIGRKREHQTAEEWGPLGTSVQYANSKNLFYHKAFRKIASITSAGVHEYYDLHVPDVHHYAAEGVWNHNSGKSWSGARKFAFLHALNTESEGMIIAPTREDLVRDIVPKFIDFCNELNWTVTRKEQPLRLNVLGRTIHCMSAEEPRRISAFTVGHGWVDEAARVRESKTDPLDDAPTQIRGRLRCKKAKILQLIVTTTPEGVGTWVQRDWIDDKTKKPNHRVYFLKTVGNTALHEDYFKDLMSTIPADLVDQYLEGHAVDFVADRAHKTFTLENHSPIEMDPRLPLHIGLDFNVDPMCWVAVQLHDDQVHVVDEIHITNGTVVDVAFTQAVDKGWFKCPRVIYHPDKSSKARSTTGEGEFATVQALTRKLGVPFTGSAMGQNPPVLSRIGKLSRAILSADGQRRLKVNENKCPRVILEMRTTGRKSDGAYDPGRDGDKGHGLDALGYVVYDVMPDIPNAAGTFAFKY